MKTIIEFNCPDKPSDDPRTQYAYMVDRLDTEPLVDIDAEYRIIEPPAQADKIAQILHYPDHWDTAAYPTINDAIIETLSSLFHCSECAPIEPIAWTEREKLALQNAMRVIALTEETAQLRTCPAELTFKERQAGQFHCANCKASIAANAEAQRLAKVLSSANGKVK